MRAQDFYNPSKKNQEILSRAWELVNSVPYKVSGRWVFYQLLQEGYYRSKADYNNKWQGAISRARHAEYEGWQPDTLTDETREPIYRGNGYGTGKAWLRALSEELECNLNKWHGQSNYVELWFEARAMTEQFKFYTKYITLRPMGGQPSIPYKFQAAQEITQACNRYGIPVKVLYFGDYDAGGSTIREIIENDITRWADIDFDFIHCGLTLEQAQRYNVPENIDKPNDYQWEALSDTAAREIITTAIEQYVDYSAFDEIEAKETHVSEWLKSKLITLIDQYEAA